MAQPRVAVAASGGRDSTALLHCTLRAARSLGVEVLALHVHHGLMAQADEWLSQVRQQSRRWGAVFDCRRLQGEPARGQSVEAWAREERYRALTEMAQSHDCSLMLLAHHQRDQAETFLLQALRGAGAAGLSAMPLTAKRGGIKWVRPWLSTPSQAITDYVKRHRLRHVQDPSNADPRFARSRLRQVVWPALTAAFVDAEQTLAAASGHAQESAALAREVAAMDLPPLLQGNELDVAQWLLLPHARRANALRAWLDEQTGSGPPQTLLLRLLADLPQVRTGTWPAPQATLRLYRGRLSAQRAAADSGQAMPAAGELDLSQPGLMVAPQWGGAWQVQACQEGGIAAVHLRHAVVRARQGGEQFRFHPAATARSLKKQYQVAAIPAWQRQGPLLFTPQGQLMFVPGLGVDAAFQASAGVPQRQVQWLPAQESGTRSPGS